MPRLRVTKNGTAAKKKLVAAKRIEMPKFVVCETENGKFYAQHDGDMLKLCVPNGDGVLMVSDSVITTSDVVKSTDIVSQCAYKNANLRSFETRPQFEIDTQKMLTVRDKETQQITDYQKVTLNGFASTFASITPEDRDGDQIGDNAFDNTIPRFMKNPVMLIDHENSVHNIAGSFTRLHASALGLEVNASVSNAPELRKVRFLIAEGHLKAFSIGGLFRFSDGDAHVVEEIELFEISLVAVPANPDALFSSRDISITDAKSAFKKANLIYK